MIISFDDNINQRYTSFYYEVKRDLFSTLGAVKKYQSNLTQEEQPSESEILSITVNGVHAIGDTTVVIDVFGTDSTERLKAGEFLKFENHSKVYKIVVGAVQDSNVKTIKIKPPNFRNFFSLISRPVFEAYYNFQRDRQRKLLREQEAKDRELEKKRREKLELVKKMKEEQVKEEIYYSKELKKDMKIFLREQERETRKEKAKQQQEIINNLRLSKQAAAFEARQNKEINELVNGFAQMNA